MNTGQLPFHFVHVDCLCPIQHPRQQRTGHGGDQRPHSGSVMGIVTGMVSRKSDGDASLDRSRNSSSHMRRLASLQHHVQVTCFPADCTEGGKYREDDQGHRHDPRRFVIVVVDVPITRLASKRQKPQAEHVERGDPSRQQW